MHNCGCLVILLNDHRCKSVELFTPIGQEIKISVSLQIRKDCLHRSLVATVNCISNKIMDLLVRQTIKRFVPQWSRNVEQLFEFTVRPVQAAVGVREIAENYITDM